MTPEQEQINRQWFERDFGEACLKVREGWTHAHAVKAAEALQSIVVGLDGMHGLLRVEDAMAELLKALDDCYVKDEK